MTSDTPQQPDLSAAQRDELRAELEQLRDGLEHRIEQSSAQSQPVDLDEPIGRLSRMDAIQSQHMAQAGMNREQQQLLLVREALEHLDSPDFGRCRNCREPIGFDRLLFQPEAQVCVKCA